MTGMTDRDRAPDPDRDRAIVAACAAVVYHRWAPAVAAVAHGLPRHTLDGVDVVGKVLGYDGEFGPSTAYMPTPDQIADACRQVQRTWDDDAHARRLGVRQERQREPLTPGHL